MVSETSIGGALAQGLVHDAVALGELEQLGDRGLVGVGVQREREPDRPEADRRVAVDAERAAEVDVALGAAPFHSRSSMPSAVATARIVTPAHATSACSSRSPEHALEAVAAGRGMQAGLDERPPGLDRARHRLVTEAAVARCSVTSAASGSLRYCSLIGACTARSSVESIGPPRRRRRHGTASGPSIERADRRSRGRPRVAFGPMAQAAGSDAVRIVFLGGLGEIGRNCFCIEVEDRILVVDCGIMFPDVDMPGVDLVLPDFTYLRENADRVEGVVLTHAHEDHAGGLAFLLRDVSCPIYGSPLSLGLARNRIEEAGMLEPHRADPGGRTASAA